MTEQLGRRIRISGVVQGVGFRPYVYTLATRLGLSGWVKNTSAGVVIHVNGPEDVIDAFVSELAAYPPPLARIDSFDIHASNANGLPEFEIRHSEPNPGDFIPVSPDVSLCDDCARELLDPKDRRFLYPFINCTNCGPRFTIIQDIPYDRPKTTMAPFDMCVCCKEEYENPQDRRFHAQPVACPVCGPHIWLQVGGRRLLQPNSKEVVRHAQKLLREGKILAIKGLGGFHLVCDAENVGAVEELRRRKLRREKPFAIMLPDIAEVEKHCELNRAERKLLQSGERPIVVLRRKADTTIARDVAPGQQTLGVMLPYTPLHALLFYKGGFRAFVMTSGNLSEEPIAYRNEDAFEHLSALADAWLFHNRDIHIRCDDSVYSVIDEKPYPLRRSRGYAPDPVRLPFAVDPILAVGGELKNTFCLTRERYGFISHHIGDLENYETLRSFEDGIVHFEQLFRIRPEGIAYDLHPNYLATRYALSRTERDGLPAVGIQHHHAHIAACMADNGLSGDRPVIGVAFDGTGYGDDGAIWGGEFLVADYKGYRRVNHLQYFMMAGGDVAVREPWRLALAVMRQSGLPWDAALPPVDYAGPEKISVLETQLAPGTNVFQTSSMGRLFDAAAALIGVRQVINYEAQAAIELEQIAEPLEEGRYGFGRDAMKRIDFAPVFTGMINDWKKQVPVPIIAAKFHNAAASLVLDICIDIRKMTGLSQAALSGGVWQNRFLLERTARQLQKAGFEILLHNQVPANDGGLSLGQAMIGVHHFARLKE